MIEDLATDNPLWIDQYAHSTPFQTRTQARHLPLSSSSRHCYNTVPITLAPSQYQLLRRPPQPHAHTVPYSSSTFAPATVLPSILNSNSNSNSSFSNFRLRPSSNWQRHYNFNTFSPKKLFVYKKYFFPPYNNIPGTALNTNRFSSSEYKNIYTRRKDADF